MSRLYLLAGAALLTALGASSPTVRDAVRGKVGNGKRVGRKTEVGEDGIIRIDPATLAAEAGETLEVYALARMISSEHGSQDDAYCRAVAWAVRNKAREKGITVAKLLCDGNGVKGDGYFGEQKASAGTKYASTAKDPFERHIRISREVMTAPFSADFTGGATHFYSPKAQDSLARKAEAGDERFVKYKGKDAAFIHASWTSPGKLYKEGAVAVVAPGTDPRELTLYRRRA